MADSALFVLLSILILQGYSIFIKAYFPLIQYVDDYLRQRKDSIRIFVIFRVRHVKPLQLECDSMNEHVSEMVYL